MNYVTVTLDNGTFFEFWIEPEEIDAVLDTLSEACVAESTPTLPDPDWKSA